MFDAVASDDAVLEPIQFLDINVKGSTLAIRANSDN
jgi:hypothetical protein